VKLFLLGIMVMVLIVRYRKLDENGDYQFGHAQNDFWHDQVEGVGQAIKTRLLLFFDEWFLDRLEGTRWGGFPISDEHVRGGRILAEQTKNTRDLELQQRIINTQGMAEIVDYFSTLEPNSREFRVGVIVNTIYGEARLVIAGPNIGTRSNSDGVVFAVEPLPLGWRAFR